LVTAGTLPPDEPGKWCPFNLIKAHPGFRAAT
jgi:hypothetical protein